MNNLKNRIKTERLYFRKLVPAALCIIFLCILCIFIFPITKESNQNNPTNADTPHVTGQKGEMKAQFVRKYSFEDAFNEADLVAEVTVEEYSGGTYFRAVVDKVLLQDRNGNFT